MAPSVWSLTTDELLDATASAAPVPGGGAIAAVTGAMGLGLIRMALAISNNPALQPEVQRAESIDVRIRRGADADAEAFARLMRALRMAKDASGARAGAVEEATVQATVVPLDLAEALLDALGLAESVEFRVKSGIVSDVHAGADIVRGAVLAALRTADINIRSLASTASPEADRLRERRAVIAEELGDAV